MNKSAGEKTLDVITKQMRDLREWPLDDLLDAITQHQATAPILDPTAYMNGGSERLQEQERIVRAAIAYRDCLKAGAR